MKEGGIINSDFCRHPIKPLDISTKKILIEMAKKLNLISIKWGK